MEVKPVSTPSDYEQQVLQQLALWRSRKPSRLERVAHRLNAPLRHVSDRVFELPHVGWVVDNLVAGLVRCANEIAQETIIRESTLRALRKRGHAVTTLEDLARLDMEEVDLVLDGVEMRYRTVTAAHGAAAGLAGIAALVSDLVALVALNLRAAGEIATHYGYDMAQEFERTFALQVLRAASERKYGSRDDAGALARSYTAQTVEDLTRKSTVKGAARVLGTQLIRSKLAQVVPLAGMVIGGAFNAHYTGRVCETARHLYRERRLRDKYPALATA